jgi:hypothetical protein
MICDQCTDLGKRLTGVLSQEERIFLLVSASSTMKYVMENPDAPSRDKIIGNSLTTKLLLSFNPELREALLKQLRISSGVDIVLKNCPHGIQTL